MDWWQAGLTLSASYRSGSLMSSTLEKSPAQLKKYVRVFTFDLERRVQSSGCRQYQSVGLAEQRRRVRSGEVRK
jgi:hypothetical protein